MNVAIKSAKKSPEQPPGKSPSKLSRSTISIGRETYLQIDALRDGEARAAWLKNLVEKEARRLKHEKLAALLQTQYTDEVCQETLRLNEEFPIHDS